MQTKLSSQLDILQQNFKNIDEINKGHEARIKSIISSSNFKPSQPSTSQSKEKVATTFSLSRESSRKEIPIKERTYVLPTIIETDPNRRETFKFFVFEEDHKNTEKEKKMKIMDFQVKRDTDLDEIQIQRQARLNVLESLKKKSRGTMYMSELWDTSHYTRVLRASGLGKIIDQIRRSRYQSRSSVGAKLENAYKNKHSKKIETEENTYNEILQPLKPQSSRINSARPKIQSILKTPEIIKPKSQSLVTSPEITYRPKTQSFFTTPDIQTPDPHSPHLEFIQTEEEDEIETSKLSKLDTMQGCLYPMLIKDSHSNLKVKRSKVLNSSMLKSPQTATTAAPQDMLSLNLLGDYNSDHISSLTHLDMKLTNRSIFARQRQDTTLKFTESQSHNRLFTYTEETIPSVSQIPRTTKDLGAMGRLKELTNSLSPRPSHMIRPPTAREEIDERLKLIFDNCTSVKKNNEEMLEEVNRMQNLLKTASQSKRVSKIIRDKKVAKEEIKQEENKSKLKHFRQGNKQAGVRVAKKNIFKV